MLSMKTRAVIVVLLCALLMSACASPPTPTPIPALPTAEPTVAAPATAVPLPSGANEPPYPLPTVVPPTPEVYPQPGDAVTPETPRSPARPATDVIIGQAPVEAIKVMILESLPVQVTVNVQGYLPDGCTELGDVSQTREGNRLIVTLATIREAEAMCTQALVPFEDNVPIDLSGLEAGEYIIEVNGASAPLVLEAAMLGSGR